LVSVHDAGNNVIAFINGPKIVEFEKAIPIDKSARNNDKPTINEEGIGIEDYQKSNMVLHRYADLQWCSNSKHPKGL
jgi:hypothetical protein